MPFGCIVALLFFIWVLKGTVVEYLLTSWSFSQCELVIYPFQLLVSFGNNGFMTGDINGTGDASFFGALDLST